MERSSYQTLRVQIQRDKKEQRQISGFLYFLFVTIVFQKVIERVTVMVWHTQGPMPSVQDHYMLSTK